MDRTELTPDVQALILVGGRGHAPAAAHLTVPKPVLPLVDRPLIAYMIDWLRATASTT